MTAMRIVAIVVFLFTLKEINRRRGGGCCCFCNGNDNGYADDDCNSNNDNDDCLLIASQKQWDDSVDYIFLFVFNDNARENMLGTKLIGGIRAKVS